MLFPVKAALWVHQPHDGAEFWVLKVSDGIKFTTSFSYFKEVVGGNIKLLTPSF